MGEYAKYNGKEVKIGTCEQMYYLRADQVSLIQPLNGSVNPRSKAQAEQIRFRFPFPQEDGTEPGAFEDFDYSLGLYGIEPPEDIEHHFLQFVRNYPHSGGLLLSIACPRSKEGKASSIKVCYNGYSGPIGINSQRLVDGKLVLICACGDCGALYRVPTLEDAKPILDVLEQYAKDRERDGNGNFYREIARRITAGYTEPNFWTPSQAAVAA